MALIRFLLYSNLWVSICFTSLVVIDFYRKGEVDYFYLSFCFFGTIGVYNLQRWIKIKDYHQTSDRDDWYSKRRKQLFIFGVLSLAFSGASYLMVENKNWMILAVASFSTLFYLPPREIRFLHLRSVGVLKLLTISFVWSLLSIPTLDLESDKMLLLYRMLWVAGITIPFDIRDIYKDATDQIESLPQMIGELKSRILALLLFLIGMGGELIFYDQLTPVFAVFTLVSGGLVFYSRQLSTDWYIAGLVESIPAIYLLCHLLF